MSRFVTKLVVVIAFMTVVAPATRADEAPDVRLGRDVVPAYQHIHLRLDPDKRSYSGSVHVELAVAKATSEVSFHAEGQKLTRISLVQNGDTLATERRNGEHGLVTLASVRPLAPGAATLDIEFTHLYGTRAVGLYKATKDGRGYLFTQFESDDAREAFPCWDEPGFKFPYQFTLEVPVAQQALTNTPVERQSERDGWRTIRYKRTPALPSYLLAVAVGPFEFSEVAGSKVPMRIVTCQGQGHLTATATETAPRLLVALERWFGTPYPFEKLDLLAVPEFAYGAMENPGAITFRDDILLLDRSTATVGQRRSNASVICHELAHMWFGDLVTMAWWDDLWLNESFADWMAAKITDEVYPEYKHGLNGLQRIENVKGSDMQPSTHAIRDNTASSAAGLSNVGLVYSKGNAILGMFESWMGPETFQKGVRAYLKEHARGNAVAADLWRALDAASGTNVSGAMATFTDQPGVPFLRVVPVEGGVRVTQSRGTPYGISQPAMRWRVPVTLRYPDGRAVRTHRFLLEDESVVVKLPGVSRPEWVLPGGGGRGYYAWSVPPEWMEAMALNAATVMSPQERVAFIGNLEHLVTIGDVHGDTFLKSLSHFGADPEPAVLASLMGALNSVRAALMPDSLAAPFAVYVRNTLGPALYRVGFEPKPGEDETISSLRGELITWLARRGEAADVQTYARTAAQRYLADSTSVDPGVVDAVLNLAMRKEGQATYEDIRRRFESANVPALRRRYLAALGAFDDSVLVARTLEYALSDAVRGSEFFIVLAGAGGRGEAAGERLFHWVLAHYDAIAQRVPPPALRFMPRMGSGCSEQRLAATKAFFSDPARGIPGVEQTLQRVSDDVHECISLRSREGASVSAYLRALSAN